MEGAIQRHIAAFALFLTAFMAVPFAQLEMMTMMPGDIGDSRLLNYLLENIYQFLAGRSASLWHLQFFYPFPYILGFSDNLFGSAPIYLIARILTGESDTAYQIWYQFGYFANFTAAYYALNRLGNSWTASAVGALIFAFALPVTAQAVHAQLHYRFGMPIAAAVFILFLEKRNWNLLLASTAWGVWQFYCGVYIGFFTLLTIVAIIGVYVVQQLLSPTETPRQVARDFYTQWYDRRPGGKLGFLLTLSLLALLLALLFYPYFRVTQLYGADRSLAEIASMLPGPESYFLSDKSWLWSSQSRLFSAIPMRHEHQMFIGSLPLLLALLGFLFGSRARNGLAFQLLAGSLAVLTVLTLYIGGSSLWLLFAKLPLASAMRAMTRIVLVMLFPVAYLSALAVDMSRHRALWLSRLLFVVFIPLMIFEFSAISPPWSKKSEWRARLAVYERDLPKSLPADPILFFAQRRGPFFADELDAMWVAFNHDLPTLNGYSGLYPPGLTLEYGDDCSELPRRILSYLALNGQQGDNNAYANLIQRVVPIGFHCDQQWLKALPPPLTKTGRVYSADEIRRLSLEYVGKSDLYGRWAVDLRVENRNALPISALSSLGKPIRLSWRFVDASGRPESDWNTRKDLPFDIAPESFLNIRVQVDSKGVPKGSKLQVAILQEHVFWAHDIGIEPLSIPWE